MILFWKQNFLNKTFLALGLPHTETKSEYDGNQSDYGSHSSDDFRYEDGDNSIENDYEEEEITIDSYPNMLSKDSEKIINEKATIKLPCLVDKLSMI